MTIEDCIHALLSDAQLRSSFLNGTAVGAAAPAPVRLLSAYLQDKSDKLHAQPHRAKAIAVEIRERVRIPHT